MGACPECGSYGICSIHCKAPFKLRKWMKEMFDCGAAKITFSLQDTFGLEYILTHPVDESFFLDHFMDLSGRYSAKAWTKQGHLHSSCNFEVKSRVSPSDFNKYRQAAKVEMFNENYGGIGGIGPVDYRTLEERILALIERDRKAKKKEDCIYKAWENEPDEKFWMYKSRRCLILRHGAGFLRGYVGFPKGDNIKDVTAHVIEGYVCAINFSSDTLENLQGYTKIPGEYLDAKGLTWLGFDCGHSYDYCPNDGHNTVGSVYRTMEYVTKECESMVDQALRADDIPDENGITENELNGNRQGEAWERGKPISKLRDIPSYSPRLVIRVQNEEDI